MARAWVSPGRIMETRGGIMDKSWKHMVKIMEQNMATSWRKLENHSKNMGKKLNYRCYMIHMML